MVLFYGYKFSNMGMQGKCVSFYLYGSFLWLQIFKYWYAKKICVFLFIWFFFIVTNFQILVCKENVFLFISMVLFYGYKFSNMDVQGNESSFFTWNLKVCPKSVVQSWSKTHYSYGHQTCSFAEDLWEAPTHKVSRWSCDILIKLYTHFHKTYGH